MPRACRGAKCVRTNSKIQYQTQFIMSSVFKAIKFIGGALILVGFSLIVAMLWSGRGLGPVLASFMVAVWGVVLYFYGWTKTWIG